MSFVMADAVVEIRQSGAEAIPGEVSKKISSGSAGIQRAGLGLGSGFGKSLIGGLGLTLGVTAVAGAIKNVVGGAISLESQFDSTMSQVAASTGAPAKAMKSLEALAIQQGKATVFSANESSEAMLELAKAGLKPATIAAGGLQGTLLLAAAGGTSMSTAATIASNALNTFGLKGSQMASVASALAGGANASSASVESLGQALSQVGPGATNAGLSLQDTVGALAAFDSAGIKGSDAGTSLKTMLANLLPQTDAAAGAMKDLGLNFVKSNGDFKSITNVAGQLHDKLGGLTQAQKAQALTTLFGSDASRAATVLTNEGAKGLSKYIAATKDQDAAQKMANARMRGTAGALEGLGGAWETAQLELGKFIQPAVVGFLHVLTAAINGIGPVLSTIGSVAGPAFAAISSALGPVVTQIGATLGPVLAQLGATLGPLLAQLGAAIGPIIQQLATAAPAVSPFMIVLQALLPVLPQLAAALMGVVGPLASALIPALTAVLPPLMQLGSVVQTVLGAVLKAVIPIIVTLASTLGTIITAVAPVIGPLAQIAGTILGVLIPVIKALLPVVTAVFGAIGPIVKGLAKILTGVVNVIVGLLTGNFSQAFKGLKQIVGGAVDTVGAVFKGLVSIIGSVIGAVVSIVKTLGTKILAALGSAGTWLAGLGAKILAGFISGFQAALGVLSTVGSMVKDALLSAMSAAGSWLLSVGTNIVAGLKAGISAAWNGVVSWLGGLANSLPAVVRKVLGIHSPSRVFAEIGKNIVDGLTGGILGNEPQLVNGIKSMLSMANFAAPTTALYAALSAGVEGARTQMGTDIDAVKDRLSKGIDDIQQRIDDKKISKAKGKALIADLKAGSDEEIDALRESTSAKIERLRQAYRSLNAQDTGIEKFGRDFKMAADASADTISKGMADAIAKVNKAFKDGLVTKEARDKAISSIRDTGTKEKEAAQKAADDAKAAADKAAQAAQDLADKTAQALQDAADKITASRESATSTLAGVFTDLLPDWRSSDTKSIQGTIDDALTSGLLGATFGPWANQAHDDLTNFNNQIGATLNTIAAQRADIATQLSAANSDLSSAISAKDSFTSALRGAVVGFGDVAKAYASAAASSGGTIISSINGVLQATKLSASGAGVAGVIANLKDQVAAATKFRDLVKQLEGMGLDKTTEAQIVAQFQSDGKTSVAEGLVAGGSDAIKEIAGLQSSLADAGQSLADATGATMYDAGIQAAQGLVNGLAASDALLKAQAESLAGTLVNTVKAYLGIHSPSRLFDTEVGQMIAPGIGNGIDKTAPALNRKISDLVDIPEVSVAARTAALAAADQRAAAERDAAVAAATVTMAGTSSSTGATTITNTYHVTIQATDLDSVAKVLDVFNELEQTARQGRG